MILPNLRERLTDDDHDVVLAILADGDAGRRRQCARRAAELGPDVLLDEPGLPRLLQRAPGYAAPSAALYIYVAIRHALLAAGIDDRRLSDYLGTMVFEFASRNRAWRITTHDDAEYRYLADILTEAEETPGQRGFLLRVHLGHFSLWLAGIFPDHITARRARHGGPGFDYYDTLGARGFRLASAHRSAHQFALADIYTQVAESFEQIRVILNRLSDQAFFRDRSSPDRLMRQVADEFRYPTSGDPLL